VSWYVIEVVQLVLANFVKQTYGTISTTHKFCVCPTIKIFLNTAVDADCCAKENL